MRTRLLSLGLIVAIASGCGHGRSQLTRYRAVVEVAEAPGKLPAQYYTPATGPTIVTKLRLRIIEPRSAGPSEQLTIVATGLSASGELGRPHEFVTFTFPGPLPLEGEVKLEALGDYRVERMSPSSAPRGN